MFTDYPEADNAKDAIDIATRRAKDAGWRVLVVDEAYASNPKRGNVLQLWVVRLHVVAR